MEGSLVYLNHYIRKIAVLKLKTQILDSLKKGKNIEQLKLFNRLEEDYSLGFQLDLARIAGCDARFWEWRQPI